MPSDFRVVYGDVKCEQGLFTQCIGGSGGQGGGGGGNSVECLYWIVQIQLLHRPLQVVRGKQALVDKALIV